jgi:hypothetical protein
MRNHQYFGATRVASKPNAEDCKAICARKGKACVAIDWNKKDPSCWLFDRIKGRSEAKNAVVDTHIRCGKSTKLI